MCLYSFTLCDSYTMGCLPVRGDNPRALASGLSYIQVDKYGITILYHLHSVAISEFPKWQTLFYLQKISILKIGKISKRAMQII